MLEFQLSLEVMVCYRYCFNCLDCCFRQRLILAHSGVPVFILLSSNELIFILQSTEEAIKVADQIGYPVMIKVSLTSEHIKSIKVIAQCSVLSKILLSYLSTKFNLKHDLISRIDAHVKQGEMRSASRTMTL